MGRSVIRLEWVHAEAAARRWEEEVLLLMEESRRVVASFEADRQRWLKRRSEYLRSECPPDVRKGMVAYANRQAHVYSQLAAVAKGKYDIISPPVWRDSQSG